MENYFILKGKEEFGPFTLEMIRSQELLPETLIRCQNNCNWTPVSQVEELANSFLPSATSHQKKRTSLGTKDVRGKLLKGKTYEPFFPILIVLFLGSFAVAMGKRWETKISSNTNDSRLAAKTSSLPALQVEHTSPAESIVTTDSLSHLENKTLKHQVTITPRAHAYLDRSEEKAKYFRDNWSKFMTLTNSNYKHRLLGGIKGLAITFTNNTDYPVDEVMAEITYIKANNQPWKTITVPISYVAPHSERQQEIAKVSRSKSVKIRIQKITSSALHLHYEGKEQNNH
jgi:GYF domain 2